MQRTPVTSSNIVAIGYDPTTQTLEVEFTNGAVYQYADVPDWEHDAFINADSKGSYLHTNIKKYACVRL